ncbi:filamentous hemagglutinin N-terminal domain-containing protein [Cupriavidus sp. 2MCAB6]|uniref:filamentous hemagglutinin N-terminal domain-containing protein n=1 Tax=Cupriavidus sp. 2MCAB6 TaxID=3232981 RepID=UPI003F8EA505
MFATTWSLAGGVTPDGGTVTTAATGANGRITVGVAQAVGGVSTNTYRDFNVPRAGVDLDNNAAHARTILNQVTSTNPSILEGPLSVLGPRANVILANPNGISVNGASVHNIGNLALTTGQVSFNDFTAANGQLQRNVVLNTSAGAIEIGPEGLSGTLLNLELVAKQIRIEGKLENLFDDANARIRAVAGTSRAEIDTSVSPTDNLSKWISYSAPALNAGQGIALDITAAGSLSAGRIELLVTDQGAGVRHAGAAYATAGDFIVSGTGDLQLASGRIGARQDVLVGSGGLTGTGSIDAGRNLQVISDRVSLTGSALSAGTRSTGDLVIGATGQVHSQPIQLTDSTLKATGGIGLFDAGAGLSLNGTQATAAGNLLVAARLLQTTRAGSRSALVSRGGVVTIQADAAALSGTNVDGMAGTGMLAQSLVLQDAVVRSTGGGIRITAAADYAQHDSSLLAATDIRVHGGTVLLDSVATQSSVIATGGGVVMQSDGDLRNTCARIEGRTRMADDTASAGAVTIRAGGSMFNTSTPQMLGIVFGVDDDVVVQAGADVINRHARMISNGYLNVRAAGDLVNDITKQAGANDEQRAFYAASGKRWLVLSTQTAGFDIDYGHADQPGQLAYLKADKGMTLSGRNVINRGGEFQVDSGNLAIRAADTFRTEGVPTGSAHYSRSCLIVCRTSASSTTTVLGGLLSASGNIDIHAGKVAANLGGRVWAMGDLTVTAPVTYATGITGYTAIARDRGFKAFFGDTWARLYAMDVGGSWMAAARTRIVGDTVTDGGSFEGDVSLAGTATVIRPRQRDPVAIENHLGLTSWFWR